MSDYLNTWAFQALPCHEPLICKILPRRIELRFVGWKPAVLTVRRWERFLRKDVKDLFQTTAHSSCIFESRSKPTIADVIIIRAFLWSSTLILKTFISSDCSSLMSYYNLVPLKNQLLKTRKTSFFEELVFFLLENVKRAYQTIISYLPQFAANTNCCVKCLGDRI